MRASWIWLKELSGVDVDSASMAARLTAAGLEVEGMEQVGAGLGGVVVVEVRGREPHPKADKLSLVDVFDGREVTRVVCGAANVPAPGGKVAWARPGSTLPGGRTITPKEVRGVLSPGMLCADDELGLGSSHEGLLLLDDDAPVGADLAVWLDLPDTIFEINVTPNRPDCLGHFGLAREVVALFRGPEGGSFLPPPLDLAPLSGGAAVDELTAVELLDEEGCGRYTARVITGVRVGQSRLAVRLRLAALGIRPINDIVDATNITLLETGQPLHAFDLDRLAGGRIVVRRARPGERIRTLDGQERQLTPEDVTICDAERPVAVAGVMGGADSEVGPTSTRILLESAHFAPTLVRRTGKRLGLHSEAAQRFERGVDPAAGVEEGSRRCAARIAAWTGGRIAGGVVDRGDPRLLEPRPLQLRPERTLRLLGAGLGIAEQRRILGALGIACREEQGHLACAVPTFRPDLSREIDLIEEIARVHGYDRIPATLPERTSAAPVHRDPPELAGADAVRDILAAQGLSETISFAFIAPDRIASLTVDEGDWRGDPIRLANPLREEQSVLRTTLLPNLLAALRHNLSRGVSDVRLFEVGSVFRRREKGALEPLPIETIAVGGLLSGRRGGWLKVGDEVDFYDLKAVVEALLEQRRVEGVTWRRPALGEAPFLHPGVAASLVRGGDVVGWLGELHPDLRRRWDLEPRAFAFELPLDLLLTSTPIAVAEPARYPGSSRDLSFFVDIDVEAAAIREAVVAASTLVASAVPREDYREAGRVPPGKKGLLWSLSFRARDRTLTDDEINRDLAAVLEELKRRFQVEQR